jgi:hypothetical protein
MGWVVNDTSRPIYSWWRSVSHWTEGWVGRRTCLEGAEDLAPTGIRSPDRPARSESLYWLSYPGTDDELYNLLAFTFSGYIFTNLGIYMPSVQLGRRMCHLFTRNPIGNGRDYRHVYGFLYHEPSTREFTFLRSVTIRKWLAARLVVASKRR